jgi:hypothetical protein
VTDHDSQAETRQAESKVPGIRIRNRPAAGLLAYGAATVAAVAVLVVALIVAGVIPSMPDPSGHPGQPISYVGVYEPGSPNSYSGIERFAHEIGRQPNLVVYYSHWLQPFRADFAATAAAHGATTLVQIAPNNVSVASIAAGQYDSYIRSYAISVKAFHYRVILSFGHEMNGYWYSWGYKDTPAAVFVAAWRRIVTIFREEGAINVTWMWTVNITATVGSHNIPSPARWWPGSSYVNWVGIDGYYYNSWWTFASLFGPTVVEVRQITRDPILIAETGAATSAGQAAKISDLFAGVSAYGLLGLVWFDSQGVDQDQTWQINSPAAEAAFREAVKTYLTARPVIRSP